MKKYLFLVVVFFVGCDRDLYTESELKSVLGVEVNIDERVFYINEWAGTRGDGYTLSVYGLSESTIYRFVNGRGKASYPQLSQFEGWRFFTWEVAPIKNDYQEVYDMLTSYSSDNEQRNEIVNELKNMLASKQCYYAFYSKRDLDYPSSVCFFLINPSKGYLYIVEVSV